MWSTYLEIHPDNPQPRQLAKVVDRLEQGGTIALPTDSGYAIACKLGNKAGLELIGSIRKLGERHNYSLLCHDFSQVGRLVDINNVAFRTIKALTPGPYTFILEGTKEVPRMTLNRKKHTIGIRIPAHGITQALLAALGEPLLCSTLILPGEENPMTDGWQVQDQLGHLLAAVIEGPVGEAGATSVVDFTNGITVLRRGAGDISLFE